MGLVTLVCLLLAVLWEELAYIKSHLDLPSIWFLSHLVPQRSIEALYLCQNRHTRPITTWNFQHSEKQPPTSINVENYVFFYFSIKFLSNLGNVENSQAMAKWPKTLKIANLAINSQKWTHWSLVLTFPDTRESQSEGGKNCSATLTLPKRPPFFGKLA